MAIMLENKFATARAIKCQFRYKNPFRKQLKINFADFASFTIEKS
jgi:hypothetical protein